jgi:hypothetical protein
MLAPGAYVRRPRKFCDANHIAPKWVEKINAAHLPVKGLMDLMGETISRLIDTRKVQGVRAEKDDLILIRSELFPPPHLHGKLTPVAIRGNELIQQYGQREVPSLKLSGNYMAYRGEGPLWQADHERY